MIEHFNKCIFWSSQKYLKYFGRINYEKIRISHKYFLYNIKKIIELYISKLFFHNYYEIRCL